MSRSGTYRDHTAIIRVGVGPWPLESPRRPGISMPGPSTKSLTTLVPRLVRARSPACESDNRPGRIACYYYQITIPSNWYAAGRLVVRRHRCAAADRDVEMARGRHRHIHGPGPTLQRVHRHRLHRRYCCLSFGRSGVYPGGRALGCGPGGTLPSGYAARRYSSCHWRSDQPEALSRREGLGI